MGKRLFLITSGIVAFGLMTLIGLSVYIYQQLPKIPLPPKAPVLAVPPGNEPPNLISAYSGPHLSLMQRPVDSFNYPIAIGETGPSEPLYARHSPYPFLCGKDDTRPGVQPLIDNHEGFGVPIFNGDDQLVGYSKDCHYPTQISYFYNRAGTDEFYPLSEANNDIATINLNGEKIDFVVRVETGTINRFIYALMILKGPTDEPATPDQRYWNQHLLYQFQGGVGIGRRQGNFNLKKILANRTAELQAGYAVAFSTGNQTSNHYNMVLAEDTALRVKKQFSARYGKPDYTIGIGGSGGAIQQYLIAQNGSGLLDAAIPQYAYPDMVTQTTYVMDCEPLEYFFDVIGNSSTWNNWRNRQRIIGLNADPTATNPFNALRSVAELLNGHWVPPAKGMSECVEGWRGLTPLVNNPTFTHLRANFASTIVNHEHWTHWDDLKYYYGTDARGYANSTWDNIGVQYGLAALKEKQITPEEFLYLNANIGGWKSPQNMQPEKLWILERRFTPVEFSSWGHHNMTLSPDNGATPAKRTRASLDAIRGAYFSGHVFIGFADIPIIDMRHYLEDELNMHHTTASFATRLRLLAGQGHADNQVIWVAHKDYDPVPEALQLLDKWLQAKAHGEHNRPTDIQDTCFNAEGDVIAMGPEVWNGDWNQQPQGECMKVYPRFKTSREVAGDTPAGITFKCATQTIKQAITAGVYGEIDMRPYRHTLRTIFPEGVCDYSKPDQGLPEQLMSSVAQKKQQQQHWANASPQTH